MRTSGTGKGSAARQQTATTGSLAPTLRPAVPEVASPPPAAGPSVTVSGAHDRWFDLAALAIVAMATSITAATLGRRHRKGHAERILDRAASQPEFADPAGVARRRLRSVE